MNRPRLSFVASLILLLGGVAFAQTTKPSSTYVDDEENFSITFAKSWKPSDDAPRQVAVMYEETVTGKPGNIRETCWVQVNATGAGATIDDWIKEYKEDLNKHYRGVNITEEGDVKVAGIDGKKVVFQHNESGTQVVEQQAIFLHDVRAFVISLDSSPDEVERYKPVFERIVKSFRLTK